MAPIVLTASSYGFLTLLTHILSLEADYTVECYDHICGFKAYPSDMQPSMGLP